MKEFIPCRKCVNKYSVPGYLLKDREGKPYVIECDCHRDWREARELQYKCLRANIWYDDTSLNYEPSKDYLGTESEREMFNVIKFANSFETEPFKSAIIYMWGTNGTQKTTLAHWIGLTVIKKGFTVKYMSMQHFVQLLSDFEERKEKDIEVDELREVDLLILDESFSKDKVTLYKSGFQLPFIETFLKERIEYNKKSTVFISNTNVTDISSHGFNQSIQDFIIRNTKPKGTILEFKDKFLDYAHTINISSIFN